MTLVAFEWTSSITLENLPHPIEIYESDIDIPIIIGNLENNTENLLVKDIRCR